jgi:hypothetical protein
MFAAMITLPPFRGFVGAELAKLGGRHGHRNAANVGEPRLIFASARPALVSLLSLSITSAGVPAGAPTPGGSPMALL